MEKRTRRVRRTKRVHLLLSHDEWDMVLTLADEEELTVSDVVRQLIRRRYNKLTRRSKPGK